jgi:hypothetical protein
MKARYEEAFLQLLTMADELHMGVEVKDPEVSSEMWPDAWGVFDPCSRKITLYKRANKSLNAQHVFTFAHELRHAHQYITRMYPKYWLSSIGLYPRLNTDRYSKILEQDADDWAKEFMIKNYLPVPTNFEKKLI